MEAKRKQHKDFYHTDMDYLDLTEVCSAKDCTGLIPTLDNEASGEQIDEDESDHRTTQNPDCAEAYKNIYNYGTPVVDDSLQNNLKNKK